MKILKGVSFGLAALICTAALGGCGGNNGNNDDNGGQVDAATQRADNLVKNFWDTDIMYDETLVLVAPTDANGEITAMPSGQLLFKADEILEVKQYFHVDNGGEIKTFTQGVDFDYADGVITAKGSIKEDLSGKKSLVSTSVPYITDRQWKGLDAFPGLTTSTGIPSSEGNWNIPFTESYQVVQMQLSVTYRHSETWTKATPAYQGDTLSNVVNKLKNKQKTEILVFGDSIATGANSSSVLNIEPYLKPWDQLVAEKLSRHYGAEVNVTNKAVGGWTTTNGVSYGPVGGWVGGQYIEQVGLLKLMETELASYSPDLAIIHFGLNDGTFGLTQQTYMENMCKMIDCLRQRNPQCDILLVGTALANKQAKEQYQEGQKQFAVTNEKIAELVYNNDHIACVNVGTMHQDILDSGKRYMDMTSNNVNHPNDFMMRIYAMHLLSTLIEA